MSDPMPQDYGHLLGEIKERIRSAQYEALRKVNRELISLYWDIGRRIIERQRDAGWGKPVVENLAEDLQAEFPGIGGFFAANLWPMRFFYDTYADNEKHAPLVREIGRMHNLIMAKCKNDLEREFRLTCHEDERLPLTVAEFGWMHYLLTHQIENLIVWQEPDQAPTPSTPLSPTSVRTSAHIYAATRHIVGEAQSLTSPRALSRHPTGRGYAGWCIPTSENSPSRQLSE
jgi:hypothetical protein